MDVEVINKLVKILVEKSRKLNEEKLAEVLDFVDFLTANMEKKLSKKEFAYWAINPNHLIF